MDEDSDSDSESESDSDSDNTQARTVDLNHLANIRTRSQYTNKDKRHVYNVLLQKNGRLGRLKHGVSKAVALQCNMSRRSVVRIWKDGMLGGGVNAVINKKKKRCGRKRIEIDTVAMEQIPPQERTTLESLSKAMRMSVSTLHRRLKEKFRRRGSRPWWHGPRPPQRRRR
ncbi:uncharacterized protein LOC125523309 isoform X1 [Triticum urartu]|uniref:uncharacterized protein LOC125523309 isoform X1 n=1 Tax=Triticum urartu TaxID=4572 RepID=UPI0020449533|nr:uncharacterized protein LOC125523309 isoform X1 [Triticum urartu]